MTSAGTHHSPAGVTPVPEGPDLWIQSPALWEEDTDCPPGHAGWPDRRGHGGWPSPLLAACSSVPGRLQAPGQAVRGGPVGDVMHSGTVGPACAVCSPELPQRRSCCLPSRGHSVWSLAAQRTARPHGVPTAEEGGGGLTHSCPQGPPSEDPQRALKVTAWRGGGTKDARTDRKQASPCCTLGHACDLRQDRPRATPDQLPANTELRGSIPGVRRAPPSPCGRAPGAPGLLGDTQRLAAVPGTRFLVLGRPGLVGPREEHGVRSVTLAASLAGDRCWANRGVSGGALPPERVPWSCPQVNAELCCREGSAAAGGATRSRSRSRSHATGCRAAWASPRAGTDPSVSCRVLAGGHP